MTLLEDALYDLADHLDHPAGEDLADRVRAEIESEIERDRPARTRLRPWLLAAAAVVAALLVAGTAYGPTRQAVADWLGIGAVDVEERDEPARPAGDHPVPGVPGQTPEGQAFAAAQAEVDFPIVVPAREELMGVEVDTRVPGGLVVLDFGDFTLIEIASAPGMEPWLSKSVPPTGRVEPVLVDGQAGLWIAGEPHEIAYVDRDGHDAGDTVRTSGPVLLWERNGVTYRIEGFTDRDEALRVAEALP